MEIIVPFGAGGASDQMARSIQGIIAKHKPMSQPVIVLNKAGASGLEGRMDTKASGGNAQGCWSPHPRSIPCRWSATCRSAGAT
ncbi:hypothetical protein ACU4GD_21120 [Cupriavidus basilensis]